MGSLRYVALPYRDIQFTTTDDGVDIAFWEIGSGRPLIIAHNLSISHAELEWTVPSMASFYVELADRYRVIRFDPRGSGLSDEPPGGWGATTATGAQRGMSTHEMGLDISAVVAACGIDDFALMAGGGVGPVGIEYAARHSELVSALILCEAVARIESSYLEGLMRGTFALRRIETETGGELPTMWENLVPEDEIDQWFNLIRTSQVGSAGLELAQFEWNAGRLLGEIRAATLVLTARNPHIDFLSDARRVAAAIPGSQLRVVDGRFTPYAADRTAVHEAINDLLRPQEGAVDSAPSGFRTVVFTDVVKSTEFTSRVGDEEGRKAIRHLEQLVAEQTKEHDGTVIKNLGDGSLVSFGSNSAALDFALELQTRTRDGPLQLRVGMAAGEPIQENGDIHGAVVAQASRIADLGQADEIIVSDAVRQLAMGKGFSFEPRGEVLLKGFDEHTTVWKVTHSTRP